MDRSLPQKPLDIARKGVNRGALLEPIKLQRGTEKVANNPRQAADSDTKRGHKGSVPNVKKLDDRKIVLKLKGKGAFPKIEDEADQLDKSDITSDHEPPTCSENYLSDGTQSNLKPSESQVKRPLKFRIKLRKRSEPEPVASTGRTLSGRSECLALDSPDIVVATPRQLSAETNVKVVESAARLEQEVSCSTPEEPKAKSKKRNRSSRYESLFQNWVPPPLHLPSNDDNHEDWLFEKRQQPNEECGSKRYKPNNEVLGYRSNSPWPQAQWLPEAGGLYALPFTVPF